MSTDNKATKPFLFNDYFTDANAPGVKFVLDWGGRELPFRTKHSLTLGDRQKANRAAFEFTVDENNKPTLTKQDQSAYTTEVVLAGLLEWPFEYEPGKPVPINRQTVSQIDADLASALAARILAGTKVNAVALDPFGKKSDEA